MEPAQPAHRLRLPRPPAARSAIDPFIVMDVMRAANEKAAAGGDVIHMEVGQPAAGAPRPVLEAARAALDGDRLGYTEALGLPVLRARIARHYGERYGVEVSPGRVVITTGSSAGFVLAFLAVLDEGGRLALPSPGYPCYRNILRALGGEAVTVETGAATRWAPALEQVEDAARAGAQGLLLASPANPTGTMLVEGALERLVATCRDLGLWFISDEIYHGLDYAEPARTALAHDPSAIVINSFSKYFCMTGWRIGWMVVPEALVRPVERLAQNLYISPPTLSQHAALAAFDATEELEAVKTIYRDNRALLLAELPRAGLTDIVPADGAFYLYADVGRFTNDSAAFAARMLAETGIAATPGVDFDAARGARFMRFSYAGAPADMAEAARRLRAWLA